MRWIWIDKFVEFEPRRRAVAIKNISRSEDFLHDQYPSFPIMPASLMIEGMAQTAGILVGAAREFAERVILAKVKRATFDGYAIPGDQVTYEAVIEQLNPTGATTGGTVLLNGRPLGAVDLMFSHLDRDTAAQLGVPRHNFVFHEDFKRLLATYDIDRQQPAGSTQG